MERPGSLVAAAVMAWILGGAGLMCNLCMGGSALLSGALSGASGQIMGMITMGADQEIAGIDEQIKELEAEEKPDERKIDDLKGQKTRLVESKQRVMDVYPRLMSKSMWVMGPDAILGMVVAVLVLIGGIQSFRGVESGLTMVVAGGGVKIVLAIAYVVAFMIVLVPVQSEYNDAILVLMSSGSGAGMPPGLVGLQNSVQKSLPQIQAIGTSVVVVIYCVVMMVLATRPKGREWCRQQEGDKKAGPVTPA